MADRELLIKIPDNYDLSKIQNGSIASKMILNAVANGIPFPFMNKSCISSEVCEHDKNKVLDKIRAEMFVEMPTYSGTSEEAIQAYADGLKKGLDIIDKYKAESDGEL